MNIKELASQFHDDGIFLPTRSIKLVGSVDLDMFEKALSNLHVLDSETGTINIFINSEGGDVTQCMAIYDLIKGCKNFVRGMVYGEASSSASLLLQACDERLMSPNSYLMIHLGEESFSGHPIDKQRWAAKQESDTKWIENVYYAKIKEKKKRFKKDDLSDMLKFDTILKAKEAIDLGLADSIKEHF